MEGLKKFWQLWKRFGQMVGDLIGRIVLTVFYFTVMAPFGIGVRLFGDPLDLKSTGQPKWLDRTTQDVDLKAARRLS